VAGRSLRGKRVLGKLIMKTLRINEGLIIFFVLGLEIMREVLVD